MAFLCPSAIIKLGPQASKMRFKNKGDHSGGPLCFFMGEKNNKPSKYNYKNAIKKQEFEGNKTTTAL